jgi:hypothetical protein
MEVRAVACENVVCEIPCGVSLYLVDVSLSVVEQELRSRNRVDRRITPKSSCERSTVVRSQVAIGRGHGFRL